MISINNLSVGFGGTYLYESISLLINSKDRIGLVGKNGAGKSTLMKILAGMQQPDAGEVAMQSDCTVGYLPQEMVFDSGKTVFDETSLAFAEVKKLEDKIHTINEQLTSRTDYESDAYMDLIHQLNDANDRFNMIGGYTMQADIEQVLLGLGFERTDFQRMTDEFSGGWRMRIELAKILLQKPRLLLLDEPTNHLDIESIQWLEDFLKNYYGAIILISHDKAFLDNITSRTVEISLGKLYDYKANYSKYVELRKERREQQMAEAKNQEKYIDHTQQLINKYRAKANKAAFAQSLIKKLDRLEKIEVDEEETSSIRFYFPPALRSGKVVVEAENLAKSYGEKTIFSDVDFMIERQERVAFVGRNGEGKTTLSKLIVGEESFDGKLNIGYNVDIGYYAQNQTDILDENLTVFETIDHVAEGEMRKNVRSLLGSFLFSGDSVDKKVKVLSGGEKARLALCRLMLYPYNLLILDEPTNHLDMRSKDVLKNALLKYDGTLIIVSHDRDFLAGLTGKVFEFRNGRVKQYIGDVYEFLQSRKIASLAELEQEKKVAAAQKKPVEKSDNALSYEERKQQEKDLRKLNNQVSKSEQSITRIEGEIAAIDEKLMDPATYQEVMNDKELFAKYEELKKQLEKEMANWEKLQMKLEKMKQQA